MMTRVDSTGISSEEDDTKESCDEMSDLDSDNADDIDGDGNGQDELWSTAMEEACKHQINQSNHNEGFISLVGGRPG